MSRAKVVVDLYASVGGGELTHIGSVFAPVVSRAAEGGSGGLFIDLSPQMRAIRSQMERYAATTEGDE